MVFEDGPSPRKNPANAVSEKPHESQHVNDILESSQSSELSDLSKLEDLSDHDEENDPIVHSFGPFGDNILPRMASFNAGESPVRPGRQAPTQPLQPIQSPRQPTKPAEKDTRNVEIDEGLERVRHHAVNQLAFSRLSSTPLSTILYNLPPAMWSGEDSQTGPSKDQIQAVIDSTPCIGKVAREGKDAAGKPLESEYYYVADFDDDPMRREAVVNDLRKPGLRNCRKQHKVCRRLWLNEPTNSGQQYFWRKPK